MIDYIDDRVMNSGLDSVDEVISEDLRNPHHNMKYIYDSFDQEFDSMEQQKNE